MTEIFIGFLIGIGIGAVIGSMLRGAFALGDIEKQLARIADELKLNNDFYDRP